MKISASVYSNSVKSLTELVDELDQFSVDYFHIDCNDDLTVFEDIAEIRKKSSTPIDLHIISPEPEKFYSGICETGTELVTFQFESLDKDLIVPEEIEADLGLAIMTDTPVDVFEEYKDRFSFILFMTTTPGVSGGSFDAKNFQKIREFKKKYPDKKIHVDGGVNDEVAFLLRCMGANCAVSGSYITNSDIVGAALLKLKTGLKGVHYRVSDFMYKLNEIPVLYEDECTFKEVLKKIENYRTGYVFIVTRQNVLLGVVTDGDIRRAVLRYMHELDRVEEADIVNFAPTVVNSDSSINEMLEVINLSNKQIMFLPVVDNENYLVGAVSFNNLVKGGL